MTDRTYTLTVWGDDLAPEHFHKLTEFARSLAGDGVRVAVVDVPLSEDAPEFEPVYVGYDGAWRRDAR